MDWNTVLRVIGIIAAKKIIDMLSVTLINAKLSVDTSIVKYVLLSNDCMLFCS